MNSLSRRQFLGRASALLALGSMLGGALSCAPLRPLSTPSSGAPSSNRPPPAPTADLATPTPGSAAADPSTPSPRPSPTAPRPSAATARATPAPAPRQPNVLLISIDTLRSDRLGSYGFGPAHSPTLDRIAAEGARFTRAICQLPQTNASHAALLTGLYPSTNGVKVHMVDKLRPGTQTMASVFEGAGYKTAAIYSWVSLDPQFCGLNPGFQTYAGYVINRSVLFSDPRLESLLAIYRDIKANVPVVRTVDVVSGGSESVEESLDGRADVTTAAVLDWMKKNLTTNTEPFFLWVHYFDPHYPYNPPAGFDHLFNLDYHGTIDGSVKTIHEITEDKTLVPTVADAARLEELYQGEIAYADSQLARLFDELRARGLEDDTVVAVVADHGESFGEHGDWTHGLEVYETEIHVPVLLRYPRRVPPGQVVVDAVQLVDVMPTLLDLAGVRPPKPVQGTSFLPLITPPTGAKPGSERAAFTELADESFNSIVTKEWKLIRNNANEELQLYHISQDEAEKQNLVTYEPGVTRELNARLDELMKISGVSK